VINLKKIFALIVMFGLFFSMSEAFGQLTFGDKAQQNIEIRIDGNGTAHVTHNAKADAKTAQQVETIAGTMSNLSVTDKDGNAVQYLTLEKYPIDIVLPPSSRDIVLIKYDLSDFVVLKEGVWTLNWSSTQLTNFYFPAGVDIIWVNDRPVYVGEKGIRHHGGNMMLEYVTDEPVILKPITWEDKKFDVAVRTLTDINTFQFSQPSKTITFDIPDKNSLVVAIIPLELLWEPYDVYVNGNQTFNVEFYNNGTHVWLGFRPDTNGAISIVGTTVVPEFPLFVPFVIGIAVVLALQFRSKFNFN
jgi:hypothetical protein